MTHSKKPFKMQSSIVVSISLLLLTSFEVQGQSFRLWKGTSNDGIVQMWYQNVWNILCPQASAFTRRSAKALCGGIGLSVNHALVLNYSKFLTENETAHDFFGTQVEYNCTGDESSLARCIKAEGVSNTNECNRADAVLCTNSVPEYKLADTPPNQNNEGRLEVKFNDIWATVCADDFTIQDVNVTCANLGLKTADIRSLAKRRKPGIDPMLGDLGCSGREISLEECPSVVWGTKDCPSNMDAAVFCDTNHDKKFRLMSGNSTSAGRIEVFYKNRWGTVCGHHFDRNAATVLCRQLGLEHTNARVVAAGKYGVVDEIPIWMDNVICNGGEHNLFQCVPDFTGQPISSCTHIDDVAISCESSRLIGGGNSGKLQVSHEGEWFSIFNESFSLAAATVGCRSMGKPRSGARFENQLMVQTSNLILEVESCRGSEDTFMNCNHKWQSTADLLDQNKTIGEVYLTCGEADSSSVIFRHPGEDAMGVYEVFDGSEWGTICGNELNDASARIACAVLNLGTSFAAKLPPSYVPKANGSVILDGLACQGGESSLAECDHNPWGVIACDSEHRDDFVIYCGKVADNLHLRLVGGADDAAGRVEVKVYGMWGTVCETGFDQNAANVVCRQLGLSVSDARTTPLFGTGQGTIWLHSVNCTGEEENIRECRYGALGVSGCEHSEDIGVICGALQVESTALSSGAIAGVVIAVLILFALLGVGLCFGIRKWSSARRDLGQNLLKPPRPTSSAVKYDNDNGVLNMGFNDSPRVSHIPVEDKNGHGVAIKNYPRPDLLNSYASPSRSDWADDHQYDALSGKNRLPSDAEQEYGPGNERRYPGHNERRPNTVNKSFVDDEEDEGGFGGGYRSPRSPKGDVVFDPSSRSARSPYEKDHGYDSRRLQSSSGNNGIESNYRGRSSGYPSRDDRDVDVSYRPSRLAVADNDYRSQYREPTNDDKEEPPRYETVTNEDYHRNYSPLAHSPATPGPDPSPSYGGLPYHGGTSV